MKVSARPVVALSRVGGGYRWVSIKPARNSHLMSGQTRTGGQVRETVKGWRQGRLSEVRTVRWARVKSVQQRFVVADSRGRTIKQVSCTVPLSSGPGQFV